MDKIEKEKILAKRPRLDNNESSSIRVLEKEDTDGGLKKGESLDCKINKS